MLYNLGTIFLNLYLFPQTKGFMKSIKYTGELIDKNFSILIFPEGERTLNGKMNPFKLGIGIIASNMKIPIIPIKLAITNFFYFYALFAIAAIIGSLIFGKISDTIGPKRTLVTLVIIWTLIILLLMKVSNITTFIIAGCLGGAALGAVWTVTRPMLVKLSPKKKIAQLFGFQGLTEKFSGVLGPIVFGFVVVKANYQAALFVLLGFFALGLLFLFFVPDKK